MKGANSMKKKPAEKLEKIKSLFEKVGIDITDDQVQLFITTFELQKNEAISEAIKPIQDKLAEYQKRNFELAGALEESKQFNDNFGTILEQKIKQIESIKLPEVPKIEEAISKALTEKLNLFEKKITKLDEAVNKINEKVLPLNMAEDIKKINDLGNIFSNYYKTFAQHLTDTESADVKKLKEQVVVLEKELTGKVKAQKSLEEQIIKERQNTEITLLLENSPLDTQEKEHLYKYYEKLGHEEGKNEIEKFITIKESKEKEKPAQRSYVRENLGGVKPMNETGILRKGRPIGESSSFARDIEEWAVYAKVDEAEKV
jgi:hypothetical protein